MMGQNGLARPRCSAADRDFSLRLGLLQWYRIGAACAGPSRSELGMARPDHDVLATEVRYALADLTTMSMGELETLAQLLARKLAVRVSWPSMHSTTVRQRQSLNGLSATIQP